MMGKACVNDCMYVFKIYLRSVKKKRNNIQNLVLIILI